MSAENYSDDSLNLLEVAAKQQKALIRMWYAESYVQYLIGVIGEETYVARAGVASYDLEPEDIARVESEVESLIFADVALKALHFACFKRLGISMKRHYEAQELLEKYLEEDITWRG